MVVVMKRKGKRLVKAKNFLQKKVRFVLISAPLLKFSLNGRCFLFRTVAFIENPLNETPHLHTVEVPNHIKPLCCNNNI